jgi:hypothetical protein
MLEPLPCLSNALVKRRAPIFFSRVNAAQSGAVTPLAYVLCVSGPHRAVRFDDLHRRLQQKQCVYSQQVQWDATKRLTWAERRTLVTGALTL